MNEYLQGLKLQPGDKVNVTHMDVTVEEITFDNCIKFRKPDRTIGYHRIDTNTRVTVVQRAQKFPEHWPPQLGDVWTDGFTTVHVLSVGGLYNEDGGIFPSNGHLIRNHPDMKLAYRKGNALR